MNLINHPTEFKTSVRVVMRVLRGKDGGLAKPDHHAKKIITTNEAEWDAAVAELVKGAEPNERIYSCVDARNMNKAILEFKRRQLDADLYDTPAKTGFYVDIKNRFISSLMSPRTRVTKYFLIDCDTLAERQEALHSEVLVENIIHSYPTKNGYHYISKPFNPNLIRLPKDKIKQSALLLVAY